MSMKILCVDDNPHILTTHQQNFRKQFTIDTALKNQQKLNTITTQKPYTIVVTNMQIPSMNKIQFLTKTKTFSPNTMHIILTNNTNQKTTTNAVNQGHVFRFLN